MMKNLHCILLVDDNPADNYLSSLVIKESGICKDVKAVTNVKQALSYLEKSLECGPELGYPKPDLIFLDINMPGVDGFGFLGEFINFYEYLKNTIVIMLTTSDDPEEKQRAFTFKNVKDFFSKPLEPESLNKVVEAYF